MGVPLLWFLALLGAVSAWATAGGRRDLARFWRDLPGFDLVPLALCLALIAAGLLANYALHPWLARRRMRAAMGPPGHEGPVPVRYRFDRAGLTQSAPDLVSFVPWSLIEGVEEDSRHLFLPTPIGGVPIVLPKADLSPAEIEGIRHWARACAGRPAVAGPPDEAVAGTAAEPDAVRAALRSTPEERAEVILRSADNPWMRRARLGGALGWLVGLSLIYPVLLAALWAIDPYRVPLAETWPLFAEMVRTDFWKPAAGAAALIALVLAAHRPMRRWLARDLAAELDAAAPPGEAEILIDERGVVMAQDGARARLGWGLFRGRERRGEMLILPMRWDDVLPVPLRIFEGDALARFEALAGRHLPREAREETRPR